MAGTVEAGAMKLSEARKWAVSCSVALTLLAGCGGKDEPPKTEQPSVAFDRVANDMRDIAALMAGQCANAEAIQRAMGRLEDDTDRLPDHPDRAEAEQLVDEVLTEAEDTLASCP